MAVQLTIQENKILIGLNNENTSFSLGTLNNNNFDPEKALNIVSMLANCLCKEIYKVIHIQVSVLSETEEE